MTQAASPSIAAPPDGALNVLDLTKQYPTRAEPLIVLRGINLHLARGDELAIVGPSGSGKSTLLNILGALDRPSSGTVRLGSADPFTLPDRDLARFRSQRIGFVFQDHHLLPQCTALENVLLPKLALEGRALPKDIQSARELLRQVGLENRVDHVPAELSGGERQRVAIARALMNGPALLLCDEPTGNLDSKSSRAVGDLLHAVAAASNAILIVVTHSPALAETFARRLRMNDGSLESE